MLALLNDQPILVLMATVALGAAVGATRWRFAGGRVASERHVLVA